MIVSGMAADLVQKKKFLSTTRVRKLANGAGECIHSSHSGLILTLYWPR